ncbi:MAG TPA: hypothetical protein DCO89_02675 [Clostridiales bacterium]|nr:hypothetical protein [Clostridiales bacterium]
MESKRKKKKTFLKVISIIFIIILSLIAISHTVILVKAYDNYNKNVEIWKEYNYDGIIHDQWDFEKLHYGFGDVGANGCGAVSVYNILKLEGRDADFPKIIKQFDLVGENVFGIGGSKPSRVIRVLKSYGFNVSYTIKQSKFEEMAKNSKYSIFVYFGINGLTPFGHYQLFYGFDGEKFTTINISGKYTFEEIINEPNTFFRMMICVN